MIHSSDRSLNSNLILLILNRREKEAVSLLPLNSNLILLIPQQLYHLRTFNDFKFQSDSINTVTKTFGIDLQAFFKFQSDSINTEKCKEILSDVVPLNSNLILLIPNQLERGIMEYISLNSNLILLIHGIDIGQNRLFSL